MTHSFPTRRSSDLIPRSRYDIEVVVRGDLLLGQHGVPGRSAVVVFNGSAGRVRRIGVTGADDKAVAQIGGPICPIAEVPAVRYVDDRTRPRGDEARENRRCDGGVDARSEEHTSELQSLMRISYAVFCLKKKTKKKTP